MTAVAIDSMTCGDMAGEVARCAGNSAAGAIGSMLDCGRSCPHGGDIATGLTALVSIGVIWLGAVNVVVLAATAVG